MSPQLPRAYMNPMVLFSLRVKEKLGEAENFARNVALSQSSSLGHENGVAPQAETAVVADVDMRGTSDPSSRPSTPTTIVSLELNPISPIKRVSNGASSEQRPKRSRLSHDDTSGHKPSYRSPRFPVPSISTSSSSTPTIPTSASNDTPPTSEGAASNALDLYDSAWTPIASRPLDERTIFVLPRNTYQAMLNKADVRFHVQWELERLVAQSNAVEWEDFRFSDFQVLKGSATEATPRTELVVKAVIARKAKESNTGFANPGQALVLARNDMNANQGHAPPLARSDRKSRLLVEVDREEESIRDGQLRGVGNDSANWPFGGRISYSIFVRPLSLRSEDCVRTGTAASGVTPSTRSPAQTTMDGPIDTPDNPFTRSATVQDRLPFSMSLRAPDMPGKSFRLARRFGSRRVVTFKLKDCVQKHRNQLLDLFMGRIFVLFGRSYRAVWAPPDRDSVIAVEMGDELEGVILRPREAPDPLMPRFADLMAMFNDLKQKPGQAMAKWAARPQILFSDSIPATIVQPSAIEVVGDIVTLAAEQAGHARTEQILTDGCGLMSEDLARRVFRHPSLRPDSGRPCVIQMRLGGSKGLLALMSQEQRMLYPRRDVILRESMVKSIPSPAYASDPSLLTLDVLRCDSLRVGTVMSSEAIIAMVHGGVPADVFLEMAKQGLDELRDAFVPRPLDGEIEEDVINRIVSSCFRRGGVGAERKKRDFVIASRSTRVAGLDFDRSDGESTPDELEESRLIDAVDRYAKDPISGQSGSIGESLMETVASGFNPLESAYTGAKLHHLMYTLSDALVRRFKLPVEQSLSAFIVPDSMQILEPNEIFVCFSGTGPINPDTGCPVSYLEGACLAFRSPCKVPTDVRKLIAVYRPELAHLKDCVVMLASSTLCARSPASFLGGGDYDGDTVQLFWDKRLVDAFHNAVEMYADVPEEFEKENFDKEVMKGDQFLHRLDGADEETIVANQQTFLLGALLIDKSTGNYSDLHGNAVYTLGFAHPETIRLARMFCHVLDARKSGLRVKPDVKVRDMKKYGGRVDWRSFKKNQVDEGRCKVFHRSPKLGPIVMDQLMNAGERQKEALMGCFPLSVNPPSLADHAALSKLFAYAKAKARRIEGGDLSSQLGRLERHIKACLDLWDLIRARRLARSSDIRELYDSLVSGRSISTSPRKQPGTPTRKAKAKAEETESDLVMHTLSRQLAEVWHTRLGTSDVPELCHFGNETSLRKMKISCAAEMVRTKSRQLFPFDVDFRTTCAIRAEANGGAVTLLDSVQRVMKPSFRAPS